jgi:hypothetical protein
LCPAPIALATSVTVQPFLVTEEPQQDADMPNDWRGGVILIERLRMAV